MKEEEYKKPEFIYIDEPHEEDVIGGYEEQRLFMALQEIHKAKFSVGLRVLFFIVGVLCGGLAFLLIFSTLFWLFSSACGLFRVERFNASLAKNFKLFKKMLVIFLGGMIAVFSPPMGIGFVLMYFLMAGESISDSILAKMTGGLDPQN